MLYKRTNPGDYELGESVKAVKQSVNLTIEYTSEAIEDVIITAVEGGIGYWACINNKGAWMENKPKDMPLSQWIVNTILEGGSVPLFDAEDARVKWKLDLEHLLKGMSKCISPRMDHDGYSLDAEDADAVFQYALFDDIIYG